jgi:tungstate transport system substrate-binding protein
MFRKLLAMAMMLLFSISALAGPAFAGGDCKATYGAGASKLILATGSPGELGLVEALGDAFLPGEKATLCWRKAGSGASLKLLKSKKVDVVMVHAPAAEKKAVEDGWAIKRVLLGSNEFYIVGPKADPAGIGSAKSAAEAYAQIAAKKARFISRGDNSGTHKKEMAIWKNAGVSPGGDWYVITKDFMMASLKKANQIGAYFMTDSSTWVKGKALHGLDALEVKFKGDPFLINTYHALCQPDGQTEGASLGARFIEFLASQKGQKIFGEFGKKEFGQPLYNDAKYAAKYDH